MEDRAVIHSTFVIERNYPTTPERVFAAFADPVRKRRWFIESESHQVEEFEMDFRTGGTERARYRFKPDSPLKGAVLTNDAVYQDIVTNQRIVFVSTMAVGDNRISSSLVTVEFLPLEQGTGLILTHQAVFFEGADGPEMREEGWRKLIERLTGELTR